MKRFKKIIAICLLAGVLSGCSTIGSFWASALDDSPPKPYGGIRLWYNIFQTDDDDLRKIAIYLIPDLPISFILDTALCPIIIFINYLSDASE